MATLSKNGTEVARLIKRLPDSDNTTDNIVRLSIRSNGYILKANYCTFKADSFSSARRHTWGWKRYAKLKQGGNVERLIQQYIAIGYQVESN
jgi:hypothetical protein